MSDGLAEPIAIVLLVAVLAFAIIRPRGLPEAVAAAPAGLLVAATGLITRGEAWEQVTTMAPTVAFLAGAAQPRARGTIHPRSRAVHRRAHLAGEPAVAVDDPAEAEERPRH